MKMFKLGIRLLCFAGFLHTLEKTSSAIVQRLDIISGNISKSASNTLINEYPTQYSNIFVILSLIVGIVCLIVSLINKIRNNTIVSFDL